MRYNYHCKEHGDFIVRCKVDERQKPKPCPVCEKESEYSPTFETQPPKLVGSGFYQTDYKNENNNRE